ncbi:hypothetical protein CERSUDRAFT_52036 [Gelatoporia subvermispora B]|uniref:NADH:flavin oxidoreductase/NADH oxidase N-terminal domain-containing protein n=1 Tax=Ceriporiopsis subvermispora (strain B) TaxID=914234 RepID=M2QGX4_CERS8|nr:hypothetical protein CERSUDRAFT_52036 [Gelatoporia subvermispora B]
MDSASKLFQPVRLGDMSLIHRVVLAPLTRFRATNDHVVKEFVAEHYAQRASKPGTFLIAEGTIISAQAGGYVNIPGIWSDEQIVAWKQVTDVVHSKSSFVYLQLWALGRAAQHDVLQSEDPSFPYVSSSDVKISSSPIAPRPLTSPEIQEYIRAYANAAYAAVFRAGFDGVEIHGANGYLVDQFIQNVTNKRTDEYGGSVENRCRFPLDVLDAVVKVVGEKRVAIRLSPWGEFQGMRMDDPVPTFSYLVEQLAIRFPDLSYIHVIEPRTTGDRDRVSRPGESNDFIRKIWSPKMLISAGGYTRCSAIAHAEKTGDLIAFGRLFISNPDLPQRLQENIPLASWDRSTFCTGDRDGYIDYPFAT